MKQEKEIWRPVVGYEGLYEVSNLGRVKSVERHVYDKMCRERIIKERILKPKIDRGYLRVQLFSDCHDKMHSVHRLVAEAFLPNPNNFPCVNHKDECKTNNFISLTNPEDSNLEWCTHEYNNTYGSRIKRVRMSLKNNQKLSKHVLCVELCVIFKSMHEASRQIGVNQGNISNCCVGRQKTAGGYHWKYVE